MISAPYRLTVQQGRQVAFTPDTEMRGDLTWAAPAKPASATVDESTGEVRWTADAAEATAVQDLLVVTVTNGEDTQTQGVLLDVVPAGFQLRYADVGPADALFELRPVLWSPRPPVRYSRMDVPSEWALDSATGVLSGKRPDAERTVRVGATDSLGRTRIASVVVRPAAAVTSSVGFELDQLAVMEDTDIDVAVRLAGDDVPQLVVSPAYVQLVDTPTGWRLRGRSPSFASGEGDGLVEVEAGGDTARLWLVAVEAEPFAVDFPHVLEGPAGGKLPEGLFLTSRSSIQLLCAFKEAGPESVDVSLMGKVSGRWQDAVGTQSLVVRAQGADGSEEEIAIPVVATGEAFDIVDSVFRAARGVEETLQLTTVGGDADSWIITAALGAGVSTMAVSATGLLSGAPTTSGVLFVAAARGAETATGIVHVQIDQPAVSCSIAPIDLTLYDAGTVQADSGLAVIAVTNAEQGFTISKTADTADVWRLAPTWLEADDVIVPLADGRYQLQDDADERGPFVLRIEWTGRTQHATGADTISRDFADLSDVGVTVARVGGGTGGSHTCTVTPTSRSVSRDVPTVAIGASNTPYGWPRMITDRVPATFVVTGSFGAGSYVGGRRVRRTYRSGRSNLAESLIVVDLAALASGGRPPYTYAWRLAPSAAYFLDTGGGSDTSNALASASSRATTSLVCVQGDDYRLNDGTDRVVHLTITDANGNEVSASLAVDCVDELEPFSAQGFDGSPAAVIRGGRAYPGHHLVYGDNLPIESFLDPNYRYQRQRGLRFGRRSPSRAEYEAGTTTYVISSFGGYGIGSFDWTATAGDGPTPIDSVHSAAIAGTITSSTTLLAPAAAPDIAFTRADPAPSGQLAAPEHATGTVRYYRLHGPITVSSTGRWQVNANLPVGTYSWSYYVQDDESTVVAVSGTITVTA